MIGSGTEESPYKIKTVDDFLDIKNNPDGSETFYILESDIDFNDSIYKNGITKSRIVVATNCIIDAQNKRIRNIVFKSSNECGSFCLKKIKNAFIENVVLEYNSANPTGLLASCGVFACDFESCSFSVDIADSNFIYLYSKYNTKTTTGGVWKTVVPNFENCVFTMFGSTHRDDSISINLSVANFKRCHFIFENLICNGSGYNNYFFDLQLFAENSTFDTVYFTGKIKQTVTRGRDSSNVTWGLSHYGTFSNCYWAVQIIPENNIVYKNIRHDTQWPPTISSICFIDKDLVLTEEGGTISDYGSLKNITSEQAKSLEYLQSIGFPTFAG